MGDLRVNAVDITFNAVVRRMQGLYAPDFDIRDEAPIDGLHLSQSNYKTGMIFIRPTTEFNHIFGSDGIEQSFRAWKASAKIRRHRSNRGRKEYEIMLDDMIQQYGTNVEHIALLTILMVDAENFKKTHGFYPDPFNEWVRGKLRKPVETE